jgi:gamma-tubulin complex component 3
MGGGATSVWEHKYALQSTMIPSIMTSDFANRIFLIGKSLNFIRYSCGDSAWVENHSRDASRELSYSDSATLYSSIDSAYSTVMARLLSLMEDKFALFTHLTALKKYLLLGQGDFIALLMESLADNLDQPANSQYRHTLTAQLEHAIRNSNAQHDDVDVLRRLDARMLELSHGEIGWDVFTLEYRIDSPLDVIVTPWASKQYLKVFNFLWRVKRVQFALGITWRRCMTGARGVLGAVSDKLGEDWKMARGAMAEMIHFIDQLQWYILFEVIEAGWEGLQKEIRKPDATLDTLITAHTSYLRSITRKGLLGGGHVDFTSQLHELLKLILAYKDAIDSLWSHSIDEFGRRQELAAKIETRTKAGRWGLTEADDDIGSPMPGISNNRRGAREGEVDSPIPPLIPLPGGPAAVAGNEGAILDHLRTRLRALRGDFKAKITVLLGDLRDQPDTDMRFLGVVMNFNDVYQPARRRKAKVKA